MIVDPLFQVVEGWTEPLISQLLINDAAFNATGMTLVVTLKDKDGNAVSVTHGWLDASTSQAQIEPATSTFDFPNGPYWIRYKVTDGGGDIIYFPPTEAGRIEVYKA